MARVVVAALVLLCLGHSVVAPRTHGHFVAGQSLELRPPQGTADITGIMWRHNGNIVAEWYAANPAVTYYSFFRNRTVLDTTTGVLVISPANQTDAGNYMVDINDMLLDADDYVMECVEEVPRPRVWVKPGDAADALTLTCEGDVSRAGPVRYFWHTADGGSWVQAERKITVRGDEATRRTETFSCKVSNVGGEKESEPEENPFFPKPRDLSGLWGLVLLPVLTGAAVCAYQKKHVITERLCPRGEAVSPVETPLREAA